MSLQGWLALTAAAMAVFAIANYFPIAHLALTGTEHDVTLPGALALTWRQGHELVAVMTGAVGFGLPALELLFLFWALQAIASGRLAADFRHGMRVLRLISEWSMIPVLMLGILVAIVKLAGMASLIVGPGLWAFGVLTFLLTGLSRLSAHRLWRYAEDRSLVPLSGARLSDPARAVQCQSCGYVQEQDSADPHPRCERCGAKIHVRKTDPASRTWALGLAAAILYIPANILPVMQIRTPLELTEHTILGGVVELWRLGSWDLALIVFVASVVVPISKLMALLILTVKSRWKGARVQRQRTRLYELVEFVGQWSMLDVFVVLLLTAMADFPGVSQVKAGPGAATFGVVVVLTMLAAMSYDPRDGWDRAVQPRVESAA